MNIPKQIEAIEEELDKRSAYFTDDRCKWLIKQIIRVEITNLLTTLRAEKEKQPYSWEEAFEKMVASADRIIKRQKQIDKLKANK